VLTSIESTEKVMIFDEKIKEMKSENAGKTVIELQEEYIK